MKHFILLLTLLPSALCGMFRNPCDETFGGHMLGSAAADETAECPALPRLAGIRTWWTDFQQKHPLLCTTACRAISEPKTLEELINHARKSESLKSSESRTISEKHVLAIRFNEMPEPKQHAESLKDALEHVVLYKSSSNKAREIIKKQLENMLLVQRFFEQRGYTTFYHGASQKYAQFLKLNRRLHAYTTGKQLPELWQYLRIPGDRGRSILRWCDARFYTSLAYNCHNRIYDNRPKIGSRLLSVAYTPLSLDVWSHMQAAPLTMRSLKYASFINKLWQRYGCTDITKLSNTDHSNHDKSGICVQIFIHRSLVNQLVYPSWCGGIPKYSPLWRRILLRTFATYELKKLNSLSLQSHPETFNEQARILLNPSYFDTPNTNIKIIVWDFRTPKEQETFNKTCDEIMALIKPHIDAHRRAGEELSAERIAETLFNAWPER